MCWIDWDYPQSIVTLHIYRVGRSVSNRSRISHVKIQFLSRIGLCRPVWPHLDRSDQSHRGASLPRGITCSSRLQIGHSIYAFRSSRQDLHNGAVQLVIWKSLSDWSDQFTWPVWPVCPDCPANLNCSNFGCQHMPPYFLVKLAYQGTSFKA